MVRYRLNTPDVIQETIDGEALIIHTLSGIYFSVRGTGEYVWNALLAGHTPQAIAASYAGTGDPSPEVAEAVNDFVQQLQHEQLIVHDEQTPDRGAPEPASEPFSSPSMQKFTDMQELLLVDPIHEVDPQIGWPQRGDVT